MPNSKLDHPLTKWKSRRQTRDSSYDCEDPERNKRRRSSSTSNLCCTCCTVFCVLTAFSTAGGIVAYKYYPEAWPALTNWIDDRMVQMGWSGSPADPPPANLLPQDPPTDVNKAGNDPGGTPAHRVQSLPQPEQKTNVPTQAPVQQRSGPSASGTPPAPVQPAIPPPARTPAPVQPARPAPVPRRARQTPSRPNLPRRNERPRVVYKMPISFSVPDFEFKRGDYCQNHAEFAPSGRNGQACQITGIASWAAGHYFVTYADGTTEQQISHSQIHHDK